MLRIVDAVEGFAVDVVVMTVPALNPGAMRVPAYVTVHRFRDHAQRLAHACLTIGHGGRGTAMRALAHDVPR